MVVAAAATVAAGTAAGRLEVVQVVAAVKAAVVAAATVAVVQTVTVGTIVEVKAAVVATVRPVVLQVVAVVTIVAVKAAVLAAVEIGVVAAAEAGFQAPQVPKWLYIKGRGRGSGRGSSVLPWRPEVLGTNWLQVGCWVPGGAERGGGLS